MQANPCKPELGKVSKQIVENIVHDIRTETNTNQWKNTNDVINRLNAIKDKSIYTMICVDICDFYPSITNTLLQKALNYASKYADISKDQIHLITHMKKTTLYKDGNPWEKTTSAFDVTMGICVVFIFKASVYAGGGGGGGACYIEYLSIFRIGR